MRLLPILMISLLTLMLVASACGPGGDSGAPSDTERETAAPDTDTEEEPEPTVATETTGINLPDEWPSDIPLMAGFTVVAAMNLAQGIVVSAHGDVPFQEVADFYGDLPGWGEAVSTVSLAQEDGESHHVTYRRGDDVLQIAIVESDEGTELALTYVKGE